MIKLLILDIDGVMTDGSKLYGIGGSVIGKTYNDKDFTAIQRFHSAGIRVCFLSGDDRVNKAMATERKIDFYYARGIDKVKFVKTFTDTYKVSSDKMIYVGDDLPDVSIMKAVGHPYCPEDAPQAVKSVCGHDRIIPCAGGKNVVSTLYDMIF